MQIVSLALLKTLSINSVTFVSKRISLTVLRDLPGESCLFILIEKFQEGKLERILFNIITGIFTWSLHSVYISFFRFSAYT